MNEVLELIQSLIESPDSVEGRTPIRNMGLISCKSTVKISHIPFYDPCFILVLSGRKVVFVDDDSFVCETGTALTVPAPSTVTMRNETGPNGENYKALIVAFQPDDLERLHKAHNIQPVALSQAAGILTFDQDDNLVEAVKHYLSCQGDATLINHRLLEILLILAGKDQRLLSYVHNGESWARRTRILLSKQLEHNWSLAEVCEQLATSESSLRRNLKQENTGFREILSELRLGTALTKLLTTAQPVYQIAYDCGYQSVSRFTSNFHKRYGLPPAEFRSNLAETEQKMDVAEHQGAP